MLGLIWVQTVCKGYQHTTKVATRQERVNKMNTLSGEANVSKLFCLHSEKASIHFQGRQLNKHSFSPFLKRVYSKKKKLFPFHADPFQKGFSGLKSQKEITKVIFFCTK